MASITFVIPCFNHGRFVREAVDSCVGQEGAEVRAVVVNDGSSDGDTAAACEACRSERVAVVHQENRGLAAARNRGAAEAARLFAPEYLVFLDADDYVRPGFAKKLAAAIAEARAAGRDEVSHAYCQEELIELGTGIWRVPEWDPLLLMVTNLHPVTALVRRERFEAVGGFDETMREGYEDWDFWLKLAERGWGGVRVREPLFVWRRHSHTTMVMEAVKRHDALYGQLRARHREMYARRSDEVIALTNSLLRKFDMSWIDESGFPIPLQYWWSVRDEADRLRGEVTAAHDQARQAAAERDLALARERELRTWYESFAAVKLHHALHRLVKRLPGPLSAGTARLMAAARRVIVGPPRDEPPKTPV